MRTTEEWLSDKLDEYRREPDQCLKDMMKSIIEISFNYSMNKSKANEALFDSMLEHCELFLKEIDNE